MIRFRIVPLAALLAATATTGSAAQQPVGGPSCSESLVWAACAGPAAIRIRPVPGRAASQDTIPELPDRWFGSDKLKHFFLSFGTTGFVRAGAETVGAGDAARWIAPAVAGLAGIGKELSDRSRGWGFSLRDLAWDAAGVVAALLALKSAG
jgi:uncharacterized protein YfiM (DUF2279 family)